MPAVGFRPGAPALLALAAVLAALGVLAPATVGHGASHSTRELAAKLLRRDPGARLGGNTQVATATRVRVAGVPRRVNFIMGLGPRERIVGGARADQLGARAAADRVYGAGGNDLIHGGPGTQLLFGGRGSDLLYGGSGSDLLYGGPGDDDLHGGQRNDRLHGGRGNDLLNGGPGTDLLDGGPGNDRIIDTRGAATVRTGAGRNWVDVGDGQPGDRVLCAAGSIDRIHADRGDHVELSCRRATASRVVDRRPATASPAAHAAQTVTGNGSNQNPYTAPCADPAQVDCTVTAFAPRTLTGFWANEFVPAYICPEDHPYLGLASHAPFGTKLVDGVEVSGLGPVGVYIQHVLERPPPPGARTRIPLAAGTKFGGDGLFVNSATNWTSGSARYRVILHCISPRVR